MSKMELQELLVTSHAQTFRVQDTKHSNGDKLVEKVRERRVWTERQMGGRMEGSEVDR